MKSQKFTSVWDAIEDTPQAAASMNARSTLFMLMNMASTAGMSPVVKLSKPKTSPSNRTTRKTEHAPSRQRQAALYLAL
jgi:hypothetical protein